MKKLENVRITTQITVATITTTNVILFREFILKYIGRTYEGTPDIMSTILLSSLLIFSIYIVYLFLSSIITRIFNFTAIRKAILREDYIEGDWLVHNSIGGQIISVGCVNYKLIHEQLVITGTHYIFDQDKDEQIRDPATISVNADCFHGKYYNYFEIPHIGHGIARGFFSSRNIRDIIPDRFEVQVITTTSPEKIFRWGKDACKYMRWDETSFISLSAARKKDIVQEMARYKIVTMDQKGERVPKEKLREMQRSYAEINYKALAREHYKKLTEDTLPCKTS